MSSVVIARRGRSITYQRRDHRPLMKPERRKHELRGGSGTRPGTLLKKQIPIRTFAEQEKGQSAVPCLSVYSPASALGSLSSVALSSVQALPTLAQTPLTRAHYRQFPVTISSGFLDEATNLIWTGFLREAIRIFGVWFILPLPPFERSLRALRSHEEANHRRLQGLRQGRNDR